MHQMLHSWYFLVSVDDSLPFGEVGFLQPKQSLFGFSFELALELGHFFFGVYKFSAVERLLVVSSAQVLLQNGLAPHHHG